MQEFNTWFSLGITHIISFEGIDHLLFILSISFLFDYTDYKKFIFLISGFTLGHTLSLIYGTFSKFKIDSNLIEFLIPITIIISAISNLLPNKKNVYKLSFICLFFGLIHGLAFSNSISSLLGQSNTALWALLYFNLGIETAQIFLFITYLLLSILIIKQFKITKQKFKQTISVIVALMGVFMCYNRLENLI